MTNKEMFNEIIVVATENNRMDIVDFAKAEIELLNKRNNTESKAKKAKQAERESLGEKAITFISNTSAPATTMEIATALNISPQKATPILRALAAEGKIKVETIKSKNVYSLSE